MKPNLPQQDNYQTAFRHAASLLRGAELALVCARSGAQATEDGISVLYFSRRTYIRLPDVGFVPPLPLVEQILILHYLALRDVCSPKGAYVGFKHLPGAHFYDSTYQKRGPGRILRTFGNDPEQILAAASPLGGQADSVADVSVKLQVLPRIPVVVALHRSDDELPAEANVLYKDDILNYLTVEDVAVLCDVLAKRLKRGLPR